MNGILYDARKIKAYGMMEEMGTRVGETTEFLDALWQDLVMDEELLMEFMYYLDHHALLNKVKFQGYSLTDLYFWQMNKYNLLKDLGKNPFTCNKDGMVIRAFRTMLDLKKDPEKILKRLSEDRGMDRF